MRATLKGFLLSFLILSFLFPLVSCNSVKQGYEEGQKAISFTLPYADKDGYYSFPQEDKRATFVVFGFPGCVFCHKTWDKMKPFMEEHKDNPNIDFLYVKILDSSGNIASHDNFYVLKGNQKIKNAYNVKRTPTVTIVDDKGVIIDRSIGYEEGQEEKYIKILKDLLGEKDENSSSASDTSNIND